MIPYHTIIPNSTLPHQQTITSLPDTSSFRVHDKSDIHPLASKISTSTLTATSTSASTSLPVTVDRSLAVSERAMSDETIFTKPAPPTRSDSSSGSSDEDRDLHDPVPLRPKFHSRKSSGTIIVSRDSRDSSDSGPVETRFAPNDVRSMSPRRTSRDLEIMGREAREELHRHAKALQESLLLIFHRIEAVKEEHDKLDSNNKFLQKYIGDLMSTSKITSTTTRGRK